MPSIAMRRWIDGIVASMVGAVLCLALPSMALAEEYKLDTGDALRVSVFGEPTYPLEVTIDDRGAVSLPLLGDIKARGLTASGLSAEIKSAFQKKKMLVDPFVQVDIREYRPFFISGAVAQPGSFAFKPGITVRHAMAMAGGFKPFADGDTVPALKISDLRAERAVLLIKEFRMGARLDRLKAESRNESAPADPQVRSTEISPTLIKDIFAAEQEQLKSRRLIFQNDVSHIELSLARARKLAEAAATERKERENMASSQLKQMEITRSLKDKGLATSTTFLNVERLHSNYRVDIATAAAEQARIDQQILDLENELRKKHADYKLDLLSQIEQAQLDLAEVQSQLRYAAEKLLFVSHYSQSKTVDELSSSVRIVVHRGNAEKSAAIEASQSTAIQAGDVIEVSILTEPQVPNQ